MNNPERAVMTKKCDWWLVDNEITVGASDEDMDRAEKLADFILARVSATRAEMRQQFIERLQRVQLQSISTRMHTMLADLVKELKAEQIVTALNRDDRARIAELEADLEGVRWCLDNASPPLDSADVLRVIIRQARDRVTAALATPDTGGTDGK